MFVCIAGKNDIAVAVLDYLVRLGGNYKLGIVCNKTETGINGFQRSLRLYAEQNNIKEYQLEAMYEIEDLIFFSLEYDRLMRPNLFRSNRLFNIHFSKLPQYKGMYTSAIPILNSEETVGVTLHRIDYGIDTGDIIAQEDFRIDGMTCREVYFSYIKYGTELILKKIADILAGKEISYPQASIGSSYYSKKALDYSNITIDLNQTADGIERQIRAFTFREYQLPEIMGRKVFHARITNIRSTQKSGTVLLENKTSCMMATVDYNIVFYFDRFDELLAACKTGNLQQVQEICLLKKYLNEKNKYGWSPLIVATYANRIDVVKYLIVNGADIYATNSNGTNLLMYAKEAYKKYGDNTLFKLYLKLGLSVGQKDYYGYDVMYYLIKEGISLDEVSK
jgi:methionyl-tRNA formyltransferase